MTTKNKTKQFKYNYEIVYVYKDEYLSNGHKYETTLRANSTAHAVERFYQLNYLHGEDISKMMILTIRRKFVD